MKFEIQGKTGPKVVNLNRRKAIRERCFNCSGWQWVIVSDCELQECELFIFRSGKGKQDSKLRAKAIRDYCLWCMNDQRKDISKCVSCDCPLFPYRNSTTDKSLEIGVSTQKGHIEP